MNITFSTPFKRSSQNDKCFPALGSAEVNWQAFMVMVLVPSKPSFDHMKACLASLSDMTMRVSFLKLVGRVTSPRPRPTSFFCEVSYDL